MATPIGASASACPASPLPVRIDVEEKEIESSDFSWDVLGSSIASELWKLKDVSVEELVEMLTSIDLTILSTFSNMSLDEAKRKFSGMKLERSVLINFDLVLEEMYSQSLKNSRFSLSASTLDIEMEPLLKRTSHQVLTEQIKRGNNLLEKNPQSAEAIDKNKRDIGKWLLEIDETLNIYCYKDKNYEEPLRFLFKDGEYPNGKKHFSRLLQQLSTSEHERTELITLRRSLRQKAFTTEGKPKIESPERKAFRNYQEKLMWTSGEQILQGAFNESTHPLKGGKLPEELAKALRKANHMSDEWKVYTISHIKHNEVKSNYFIAAVWTEYSIVDPKELMQLYVDSLPEEWFQSLYHEISQSKQPQKVLVKTFLRDFQKKPTFESLKTWIEKNKLPEDFV